MRSDGAREEVEWASGNAGSVGEIYAPRRNVKKIDKCLHACVHVERCDGAHNSSPYHNTPDKLRRPRGNMLLDEPQSKRRVHWSWEDDNGRPTEGDI